MFQKEVVVGRFVMKLICVYFVYMVTLNVNSTVKS